MHQQEIIKEVLRLLLAFYILSYVIFFVFLWLSPKEIIEELDEDWKEGKEDWR